MMAINRYRLRHLARKGNLSAKRVVKLLERPDRLLGIILIGNTFANILAASVATILAARFFGDVGVFMATVALTIVVLIFAETTPKTFAALYPQRLALPVSLPLTILLRLLYPVVWFTNVVANGLLRLLGVDVNRRRNEALSIEELRTVVREATSKIGTAHQQMLLRILELEQMTVEDVMVPRNKILGIDLDNSWPIILEQLKNSPHAYLPLYRENVDNVVGILSLRKVLLCLPLADFKKDTLVQMAEEVYFIPEITLLSQQLLNFQSESKTIGLVVDEYGDIQGLVTMQEILEEIVGEFAAQQTTRVSTLRATECRDGSYKVEGSMNVREFNRISGWSLPADGPKTLGGIVFEYLETIPAAGVALEFSGHKIEVLKIDDNKIQQLRIWPKSKNSHPYEPL